MFPSLVNCCTIDWFTEWPREALLSVSESLFESVDLGEESMKVSLKTLILFSFSFFMLTSVDTRH